MVFNYLKVSCVLGKLNKNILFSAKVVSYRSCYRINDRIKIKDKEEYTHNTRNNECLEKSSHEEIVGCFEGEEFQKSKKCKYEKKENPVVCNDSTGKSIKVWLSHNRDNSYIAMTNQNISKIKYFNITGIMG